MVFSKSCEYALKAVLFISQFPDKKVGIREITEHIKAPVPYLKKILQILARRGILKSVKGPGGGFMINPERHEVRLIHVVEAIDGPEIFDRCGLGCDACDDTHPCPIHFRYSAWRKELKNLLCEKTFAEYSRALLSGQHKIDDCHSGRKI